MISDPPPTEISITPLIKGSEFSDWKSLNDTIMGGSSRANCHSSDKGLFLEGNLVEEGGGFVSCRSPIFNKPFNLSKYSGLILDVEGEGRTLKFAIACEKKPLSLSNLLKGDIRWVASIPTNKKGVTRIKIPFRKLEPARRAKPVRLPLRFDPSCINRFQLLHSKFGQPGKMNSGFFAGPIKVLIKSISAYS
ncbi:CIA30 family protein [Prochlorococcus sp. MIT 0801]|uniref:CIA30 family protein n=1 Tax=Prochlorococcus sp. MIT 0801 TaxID=1501269 RepID=UPI0004F6F75E|nr:CIA30 family protein [Prochlorococcus sp. MIT 0801]AIQ96952.1 NAD dependent epimerase/dehydratase [Prochlorococcus sp. MIT 0801]